MNYVILTINYINYEGITQETWQENKKGLKTKIQAVAETQGSYSQRVSTQLSRYGTSLLAVTLPRINVSQRWEQWGAL